MANIILASGSPRRRELLAALVGQFSVEPADIPEPLTGDAMADAAHLARAKAETVAAREHGAVIVAADTIVFDEVRSYGKPTDGADATAMLARLQGREHRVVTGIAVVAGKEVLGATSVSTVALHSLAYQKIVAYVESGRPLDKAGAYAIQDEDVPTVSAIDGCYCSVMGLPLWRLRALLAQAGVSCPGPDATFARCVACPERSTGEVL